MREREADDRALRWVHLIVLAIPMVLVVVLLLIDGITEPFQLVVFPVVFGLHGTLVVGLLTRRFSLRAVGPWVVLSPTSIVVARLIVWELVPASRPDNFGLVVSALAWFAVVFALTFLVFGTRRGGILSIVGYVAVYAGAVWSATTGMLADSGSIGVVVFLAAGHAALIGIVWVLARNVEQLAAARTRAELLELQATTDPLTGAANRRRLDDELQRMVARSDRYADPLSVVLVDLDQFKAINDAYGHDVGDEVLVATVARLRAGVREADVVGRWGGEEFLLLAPHTSHDQACVLAERCRGLVAGAPVGDPRIPVTASFGVATLGPDDDARTLMRRADLALYMAKSEGRDRVVGVPELTLAEDVGDAPRDVVVAEDA